MPTTAPTPKYIGVKVIHAFPMGENEFKEGKGYDKVENSRDGYAITYEGGYTSWSPKDVFEEAYRQVDTGCMSFGLAIEAMKKGKKCIKVARKGWNGKGMWLWLCFPDGNWESSEGKSYGRLPYIYMKTADDKVVPWLASQTDILADDWFIVE